MSDQLICSNCEVEPAVFQCRQCPPLEALLCAACREIHLRVKQFRDHVCCEYKPPVSAPRPICSNCEENEAELECADCNEIDKFLCSSCSVLHSKIKQFRSHRITPFKILTNSTATAGNNAAAAVGGDQQRVDALGSLSAIFNFQNAVRLIDWLMQDVVVEYIENAYEVLSEASFADPRLWSTFTSLLTISFSYYFLVKYLCGKYATLVNIAMGLLLYRHLQRRQSLQSGINSSVAAGQSTRSARSSSSLRNERTVPVTLPTGTAEKYRAQILSPADHTVSAAASSRFRIPVDWEIDESQYKNEFWYNDKTGKAASLRLRGRPYQRRIRLRSNGSGKSNNSEEGEGAVEANSVEQDTASSTLPSASNTAESPSIRLDDFIATAR